MSLEQNKAIVRRLYEEVINNANLAALDELTGDKIVIHTSIPDVTPTREGFRQLAGVYLKAFPVQYTEIHGLMAEADLVTAIHTHHVTHGGEFMGAPPSGKEAIVPGIEVFRLAQGRIVEMWHQDDLFSLVHQLGLIPQAAG
jgi:predicted ester cyclase